MSRAAAALVIGVLAMAGCGKSDEDPIADLTVGWGGSEGHPSCVYDAMASSVECTLRIDGESPEPQTVSLTVTAYADENTSRPVGSSSRSVEVEGTVHQSVVVTIPVKRAPHVDEDGEAACKLSVRYSDAAAASPVRTWA